MKLKRFIWGLKFLVIPFGFVWSTGIISVIQHMDTSDRNNDPIKQFSKEELATLEITPANIFHYGDSLMKERGDHIKKTGVYEPMLFFKDLKQYYMFETLYQDSLNRTAEGRSIIVGCLGGFSNNGVGGFVALRERNWRNIDLYNISTKEPAKIMDIIGARHYWFPADYAHELAQKKEPPVQFVPGIAIPFLGWLSRVYLRGFPFALILFLMWKLNLQNDFREATYYDKRTMVTHKAPISFIFSLLIWPIILWIDLRNRFKGALQKADIISRRSNMFSLFSKQEEKLLEKARHMSVSDFRKYLDSLGLAQKHSFTGALAAVVILSVIPHGASSVSHETVKKDKRVAIYSVTLEYDHYDVQHLEKSLEHHHVSVGDVDAIPSQSVFDFVMEETERLFGELFSLKICFGYRRGLSPVPIVNWN